MIEFPNVVRKRAPRLESVRRRIMQSRYLYLLFALPFVYYLLFHYLPIYGVLIAFKKMRWL